MIKFYTLDEVKKIACLPQNINNELFQISLKYNTSKLYSPGAIHYLEHYWNNLKNIRNLKLKILEIGVKEGQSLLMWKEFFPFSEIYGIEINPEPLKNFNHENIKIFYGDQSDEKFLKSISDDVNFDVIIDDGGHKMDQQKISFSFLFRNSLNDGGIYILEDLGTSYWKNWGGGLLKSTSTIEYLKSLIDGLNYRSYKGNRNTFLDIPEYKFLNASYYDENIKCVKFYRNICFIEKGCNIS